MDRIFLFFVAIISCLAFDVSHKKHHRHRHVKHHRIQLDREDPPATPAKPAASTASDSTSTEDASASPETPEAPAAAPKPADASETPAATPKSADAPETPAATPKSADAPETAETPAATPKSADAPETPETPAATSKPSAASEAAQPATAAASPPSSSEGGAAGTKTVVEPSVSLNSTAPSVAEMSDEEIMEKMKALEAHLAKRQAEKGGELIKKASIIVNGPLPTDFNSKFAESVAAATGCKPTDIVVIDSTPLDASQNSTENEGNSTDTAEAESFLQTENNPLVQITFQAPSVVVNEVLKQVRDENSALATGALKEFLVAKDEETSVEEKPTPTGSSSKSLDVDSAGDMPYGELEPFGREDTAQELTEQSVKESDEMVDQVERAEVAEEKRAVFRALTRLRGAAITSFDGVARSLTGNIDEYNKVHKWRSSHPLRHLAKEESDVTKWAFPENSD